MSASTQGKYRVYFQKGFLKNYLPVFLILTMSSLDAQSIFELTRNDALFFNYQINNIQTITFNHGYLQINYANGSSDEHVYESLKKMIFKQTPSERDEITAANSMAEVSVYPNPSTANFNLSLVLGAPGYVRIQLLTLQGVVLADNTKYCVIGKNTDNIQAGHLPAGVYLCCIQHREIKETIRLIKTN